MTTVPPSCSRHTVHRGRRRRPARPLGTLLAAVLLGLALPAATASAATAADTEAPTAPGAPTVAAISPDQVTLTWTAATDNVAVTGYEVAQLHTDYVIVTTTPVNEITVVGLQPSRTYQFWVAARDAAGNRSPSSPSLRLTMPPGDDQAPTAPTGLTATQTGADAVTLRWQPSTDNVYVAWYEVLRLHPDGSTTRVATAPQHPPTGPTARVGGLQPGTSYTFAVRAHDDAGNSSPLSAPLTVTTTPVAPACEVAYQVINHWPGALQAQLDVRNLAAEPIDGWTLSWTWPGDHRIAYLWGAEPVDLTPPDFTVRNYQWNRLIAPGGSVQLGFMVTAATATTAPTDFTLNGAKCTAVR
ncbi:cellulose binding domain-containing protein [Solwaraspora sp. WMMD791]|uniref:fibronectin type III domain-containing protein n=1 Tax=Solwaraspora sp. WMMD791 TaxID=3016086 RepID=UPI00249AFDE4|nr:fibronectin type III domain-containing protein [Solwaraspora sp. WMMD791]WFE25239.1 cellulose binding domain-containing protein [Solwaraspora sp. WMMD791]